MHSTEDFSPQRNREHVLSGLWELQRIIAPVLERVLTEHHGSSWRADRELLETLKRTSISPDFLNDPANCLMLISNNIERPLFGREAIALASYLRTARNQSSHQSGFDPIGAFHIHVCLCQLFQIIGHRSPDVESRRDALHRIVAAEVQPLPTAPIEATPNSATNRQAAQALTVNPDAPTGAVLPDSSPNDDHESRRGKPVLAGPMSILIGVGLGVAATLFVVLANSKSEDTVRSAPSDRKIAEMKPATDAPTAKRHEQIGRGAEAETASADELGGTPASTSDTANEVIRARVDDVVVQLQMAQMDVSGNTWQKFPARLDRPFALRAGGTVTFNFQTADQRSTVGPRGIETDLVVDPPIPAGSSDARGLDVRVIGDTARTYARLDPSVLAAPSLPYAAVIGRFCTVAACESPFPLDPDPHVICPRGPDSWLELRINEAITHSSWSYFHRGSGTFTIRPTTVTRGCESNGVGSGRPKGTFIGNTISVESNGFLFELERCAASGARARCEFILTNREEDRDLMILESAFDRNRVRRSTAAVNAGIPGTRAIDDLGAEAIMLTARLANYGLWGGTVASGVRTRLIVDFEGISAKASKLSVLDIGCSTGRGSTGVFSVQIRDVPLTP